MLTTNDRVIKLWKMEYRIQRHTTKCSTNNGKLTMPSSEVVGEGQEGVEKMQYKNCHNYNINSLSTAPDGESFLSADDLRVNMWSFENNLLAYNIVDLKPPNIEELAEVITHV
jgi:serine/threonine-protein phosphatase 2A regulatory subunit B